MFQTVRSVFAFFRSSRACIHVFADLQQAVVIHGYLRQLQYDYTVNIQPIRVNKHYKVRPCSKPLASLEGAK